MADPNTTFYSQKLSSIEGTAEEDSNYSMPSYMRAADTHNIANDDKTFLESVAETVENIPKFIGVSLISGVNEIYNIPVSVGNLFGADFKRTETEDVISAIDSDLGQYYAENKQGADLVGFIASSIIPGTLGIKALHAGQASLSAALTAGKFGENTSKSLGLLVPSRKKYLDAAVSEAINSNSTVSILNRNILRSMGAGFGQNALEVAAFETAVAATLYTSPVLEGQDLGDFASNIMWGAGVFGAVGGVIDATRGLYTVKRAKASADKEAMPWSFIEEPAKTSDIYEKIALDVDQLHSIPKVPEGLAPERVTFLRNAASDKTVKLEQRVRTNIGEISGGDQDVAEALYQATKSSDLTTKLGNFTGLRSASKISDSSMLERELARITNKVTSNSSDSLQAAERLSNIQIAYAKIHGARAGSISDSVPSSISLADTLKQGQKIEISKDGNTITAGSRSYAFSLKDEWNILSSNPLETQARHIWANNLPEFPKSTVSNPVVIRLDDPYLMNKAYKEFDNNMLFKEETGDTFLVPNREALLELIKTKKVQLANRLHTATSEGLIGADAEVVANKLRSMLGINFVVEDLVTMQKYSSKITKQDAAYSHQLAEGVSKIAISKEYLTKAPLHEIVGTILHEEGHAKFDTLLSIGGIPSDKRVKLLEELVEVSKKARPKSWEAKVSKEDGDYFAYLNDEHELMADAFSFLSQFPKHMDDLAPTFKELYGHYVRPLPKELVDSYAKRAAQLTQDDIASMVDVRPEFLSGKEVTNTVDDVFATDFYSAEYTSKLVAQGARKVSDPTVSIWNIPQHVKLTYDTTGFSRLSGHELENMIIIKQQQKLYIQATDRASANVIGIEHSNLPEINEKMIRDSANSLGAGATGISAASSNYGTLASIVEHVGKVTTRTIESFQASTRETLEPLLYKLAQRPEAAIEWATLSARLRSIPDSYTLNEARTAFVPSAIKRWEEAAVAAQASGKSIPERPQLKANDAPLSIPIVNKEVLDLVEAHIQLNGTRVDGFRVLRTSQGVQYTRDSTAFYPPPVDPKEFKHFAIVYDESITGTGHAKTIYANTEEDLSKMITRLKDEPGLTVRTKAEAEDYYKSVGQFDFEKTLNDNYLDTAMYRKGVSSPYFVPTDPKKITTDLLNWHLDKEAGLVREAISAKYEVAFNELARLGDTFTNVATSTFSSKSLLKYADSAVKNPYADYVKTALGLKKYSDYPWWVNINRTVEDKVSSMYAKVSGVVESAKNPNELAEANRILNQYGYKGAAYDESMSVFANADAPKGVLTSVVSKANSILATVVLRLDALNAVNNAISANVLLGAETKAVIRAIERGDAEAVGQLSQLAKLRIPGTDKLILSPTKLIANSIKKFGQNTPEMEFYRKNGFVTTITDQYKSTLDSLTFSGKESIKNYDSRVDKVHTTLRDLANKGEKWTGNKLAEEFNRFVAADVMKQLSDIAVNKGYMSSKEQLSYINTFVNRTQGNYLASQRPMMFQGPIGQAIGLFQTYQFNLMQQLLRHVGEGSSKDAMTLLALQGTIHGLNGLPAFNAINTTIVGNASGNKEHRDTFDAVYGIAGKEAGDWLMYGVASNMFLHPDLKVNLYTRGDINPRHVTIVPVDPASVPIVQATGKFFANIFETTKKLAAGGDVTTTILQGIEHNGISRPLAGLAQTLEALDNPAAASYSTSSKGNVIASNDLLSLANLGRIAGGKPLDEAIAQDALFRFTAYGLRDSKKRKELGEAIKTTVIAGKEPSQEQIENFAMQYAESGGKQEEFNKWFLQLYKSANLSQANKIRNGLSSQYSQSMQKIMGGYELRDFTE